MIHAVNVVSSRTRTKSWQTVAEVVNLLDVLSERESDIGERLEQLRKAHGLTQESAAHRVGVSNRQWQRWEAGAEPRGSSLTQIANSFDISISELVEGMAPRSQLDRIEERLEDIYALLTEWQPATSREAAKAVGQAVDDIQVAAASRRTPKPDRLTTRRASPRRKSA